tara:strand:- start:2 stop:619 length:618 start_codon:yes stop_codon:yes gene_type:complete
MKAIISFKKAIAKITFKKAIANIKFGDFLIFRFFFDVLGLSDSEFKAIGKSLGDASSAADSTVTGLGKSQSDQAATTDSSIVSLTSVQNDSSQTSDQIDTLTVSKVLQDSSAFSEVQNMNFHKFIEEATGVTDDLDGEATTDDDQEMTFVKVRSNLATMTDTINIVKGKLFSDVSALTDSGSLRSQGYVEFSYLSEDYVGASRNF